MSAVEIPSLDEPASRLGAGRAASLLVAYFGTQVAAGGAVGAAAGLSFALTASDLGAAGFEATIRLVTPLGALVGVALAALLTLRLATAWAGPLAREPGPDGIRFAWGRPLPLVAAGASGLLLAAAYLLLAGHAAPLPDPDALGPATRLAESPGWGRTVWLLLAVGLAPPAEEYLFRGVLLAGFARSFGRPAAGALVSLLFGAAHLPETLPFWPAAVATTSLGVLALALRCTTGRLGPAVAAHAAYNTAIALSMTLA